MDGHEVRGDLWVLFNARPSLSPRALIMQDFVDPVNKTSRMLTKGSSVRRQLHNIKFIPTP